MASNPLLKSNEWHLQCVQEAERLIPTFLEGKLPSKEELGKLVGMSESVLRRQFRKIHGKSLYAFYLDKKMVLARQLIQEGGRKVEEVAWRLGYEKTSAFINIFKKHHKITPGKLKSK